MRKETANPSYKTFKGLGTPLNLQWTKAATATVILIRRDSRPRKTFVKLFGKVRLGFQRGLHCRWCTNLRVGKRRKVRDGSRKTVRSSSASLYSFGSNRIDQESSDSEHISERLRKIEQLFEKFVCRKSSVTGAFATARSPIPTAYGRSKNEREFALPVLPSNTQSISSIGDGSVS
jgi:hypothetical protein